MSIQTPIYSGQTVWSHFKHVNEAILDVLAQAKLILEFICMSEPRWCHVEHKNLKEISLVNAQNCEK